ILLLAVVPWLVFLVWQPTSLNSNAEPVSYTLFIDQVQAGNVASVTLTDNAVTGTFKSPVRSDVSNQTSTHFTTTIPNLNSENTVPLLQQHGVKVVVNNNSGNLWIGLLQLFLPVLLLIGGIWWLSRRAASAQ